MLPGHGYQNMLGLNMPSPLMGQSSATSPASSLSMPHPYLANQGLPLSHMGMAAALDSCQARAQAAEAQVAQLMQMMELNQQSQASTGASAKVQGVVPHGVARQLRSTGRPMPEAPFSQRSLQQVLGAAARQANGGETTADLNRMSSPIEGSPMSDGSRRSSRLERHHLDKEQLRLRAKLKPQQTLRGYLEELRSENPRCIFIVRRINKLGFRSKSLLEGHYAQYGKVLQVCVAHSKVKPLPNSGQTARTRPGNFGLVVMQDPAAVQKVLDKGENHFIDGVEISVQKYQPSGMEGDEEEEDDFKVDGEIKPLTTKATRSQKGEDTGGSTQTGSSEGSSRSGKSGGLVTGDADDWNRQESGSSNSSSVAASYGSGQAPTSPLDWQAARSGPPQSLRDFQDPASPQPEADRKFLVSLSATELNELQQVLQSVPALPARPPPQAPSPQLPDTSNLASILDSLQGIAQESQNTHGFTRENIIQAATLVSAAKQQLAYLHAECKSKLAELTATAAAVISTPAPPLTSSPQANFLTSLAAGATPPTAALLNPTPPLGGLGTQPPVFPGIQAQAMAILQAQQHLNLLQAQLGADLSRWMTTDYPMPEPFPPAPPTGAIRGFAGDGHVPTVPPDFLTPNLALFQDAPGLSTNAEAYYQSEEALEDPASEGFGSEVQQDTLRGYFNELSSEDPNRIFLARRINKLGFRAQEELWLHYSKYGPVEKVLVTNAKARNSRLHPQGKLRPGSLAIVVMETPATVKEIMALGEEQLVGGQVIKLQKFEPTAPKGRSGGMKHHTEMSTSPVPADPQGSSFSGSGGSGPETKGKQEDGSSGSYDLEGEGSSQEAQESPSRSQPQPVVVTGFTYSM